MESGTPPVEFSILSRELSQILRTGAIVPLRGNPGLTTRIYGVDSIRGRLIVKVVGRSGTVPSNAFDAHWRVGNEDPKNWNYWLRERLLYESGYQQSYIDGGIAGPPIVEVCDIDSSSYCIVMRACEGAPAITWDVDAYGDFARCLGIGQGRALQVAPGETPWLSVDFIEKYSRSKPFTFDAIFGDEVQWGSRNSPQVAFREELTMGVRWAREILGRADIYQGFPLVLSHNDCWARNIFGNGGSYSLIDWGFAGFSPLGADVSNLVAAAVLDRFASADDLEDLHRLCTSRYIQGLAEGGAGAHARAASRGVALGYAKYLWLVPALLSTREGTVAWTGYGPWKEWEWFETTARAVSHFWRILKSQP